MATEYASQYTTGIGGNGIANALASPDCANGCDVKVDPSYASTEGYGSQQMNSSPGSGTHVEDTRGGARVDSYMNPRGPRGSRRRTEHQRGLDAEHGEHLRAGRRVGSGLVWVAHQPFRIDGWVESVPGEPGDAALLQDGL